MIKKMPLSKIDGRGFTADAAARISLQSYHGAARRPG
jgi:hypothetical protein